MTKIANLNSKWYYQNNNGMDHVLTIAKYKCNQCGKKLEKPKFCERCQQVCYCNKKCQKKDWNTKHRTECFESSSHWDRKKIKKCMKKFNQRYN